MQNKQVFTPREVASLLNIGMNKVYELLANGTIPAKRIGRKYLIPKAVLWSKFKWQCY